MFSRISFSCLLKASIDLSMNTDIYEITTQEEMNDISTITSKIVTDGIRSIKISGEVQTLTPIKAFNLIQTFEINSNQITRIPEKYFYMNPSIEKVILHRITNIDQYAFAYSNIRTINLESVTNIQKEAFRSCKNLHIVNLPNFETGSDSIFKESGVEEITTKSTSNYMFFRCYNLRSATITGNTVSKYCFSYCINLNDVIFQNSGSLFLKDYAFQYTGDINIEISNDNNNIQILSFCFEYSKINSLIISVNSLYLGMQPFYNCKQLRSVSINCQRINNNNIFYGCSSLQTVILNGFSEISFRNFYNCRELTSFSSNSATKIGKNAFRNCIKLISINTPKLNNIEGLAFFNCKNLTTLTIGETLSIGPYAFAYCESLTQLPDKYYNIEKYSFFGCKSLENIKLQFQDKEMKYSLSNCTSLETVTLKGFSKISSGMFSGCSNLKTINYEDQKPSEIEKWSLFDTKQLKTFYLHNVNIISDYAFCNSGITDLYIETNIDSETSYHCFAGCRDLTIHLTSSVTSFNANLFMYCGKLSFVIGSGSSLSFENNILKNTETLFYYSPEISSEQYTVNLKNIHFCAFSQQKSHLKEVTIESTNIIKSFYGCESLQKVKIIGDEITTIGDYCFCNCSSLSEISFPESVTNIGKFAFYGTKISKIDLTKVSSIGDKCFYKCQMLSDVKFPHLQTNINSECGSHIFCFTNISSADLFSNFKGKFMFCNSTLTNVTLSETYEGDIPESMFSYTYITEMTVPPLINELKLRSFSFNRNLTLFIIPPTLIHIDPESFIGSNKLKLSFNGYDHPVYYLLPHELVARDGNKLILTYGKLKSTYVLPKEIQIIGQNSISYVPDISDKFGVTTLVIRGNVESDEYSLRLLPYLTNLCYGGSHQPHFLDSPSIQRYFVSSSFEEDFWIETPEYQTIRGEIKDITTHNFVDVNIQFKRKLHQINPTQYLYNNRRNPVIKGKCNSSIPFKNYAKDDFTSPDPAPKKNYNPDDEDEDIDEENDQLNNSESNSSGSNIPLIEGEPEKISDILMFLIIAAIIEVVVIISLIWFLILKSRKEDSSDSVVEMQEETIAYIESSTAFTADNPLFTLSNMSDDPFKEDFTDSGEEGFLAITLAEDLEG